jgi:hypothetical protein
MNCPAPAAARALTGRLEPIGLSDPRRAREFGHFDLDALNFEMHVIDSRHRVFRGFYAIRRIALEVPLMWPLAALLFVPAFLLPERRFMPGLLGPGMAISNPFNATPIQPRLQCAAGPSQTRHH